MATPSTVPEITHTQIQLLESGALNLFSGSAGFGVTFGDLCSVNDVDIGNATDFPLTANTREAWVQYLRDVKQLNWSVSYNYNDGAGTVESASESGTNYLAPLSYDENSTPSLPGLEWRRRMLRDFSSIGLALRPDGFESFYITIPGAVSRETSSGPIADADLEIRFILFGNLESFNRVTNIAHDSSTGVYYPKSYIRISAGLRAVESFSDSGNVAGTATVEDLGFCNLYSSSEFVSCNFTATITSRFTDP